ncbi:MAG: hypothetical protein AB7G15_16085 [Alphaproteobacteria bacterium]
MKEFGEIIDGLTHSTIGLASLMLWACAIIALPALAGMWLADIGLRSETVDANGGRTCHYWTPFRAISIRGNAQMPCPTLKNLSNSDASRHDGTWTLYRASVVAGITRIHVATFDASEGFNFNRVNCEIAGGLFQAQPGVIVRYWCEQGQFRR